MGIDKALQSQGYEFDNEYNDRDAKQYWQHHEEPSEYVRWHAILYHTRQSPQDS